MESKTQPFATKKQLKELSDQMSHSLLLLGIKFNALKATLDEKELVIYSDYVLDLLKQAEPFLKEKMSLEKFEKLTSFALK